ncbi:hypothetical protein JCM11491_003372 [Sporobolomyces phaffii]
MSTPAATRLAKDPRPDPPSRRRSLECTPPGWMLKIMHERGRVGPTLGAETSDSCDGVDLDLDLESDPARPSLAVAAQPADADDDGLASRPHRHEFSSASSNSSSTTGGGFASSSSASSSGFSSSVTSASSTTTYSVSSREPDKDRDSGGGTRLGLGLELELEPDPSPTPSTSTLAIDPSPTPSPFTVSHPARPTSPSLVPTLKGKERAERFPCVPSPSPPRSTITLTTTTTASDAGTEDTEDRQVDVDDVSVLYPPENFAIVVPGIFRSSFPRRKNFAFLKSLGLKSVLTLIQDEYPQENLDYFEREGIQLFQFPIPGNKEPFVHIPDDKIVAAMAVLLDSRNHPLLIHCNKGKHRTGCLVGVLRRLQTWSLTAIFDEYRRYSHPKSRQMDLAFIEAFKGLDLVWEAARENPNLPFWACTTPYETPKRGEVPKEAKTKERSVSRAPSGRNSPVLKELARHPIKDGDEVKREEDTGGGGGGARDRDGTGGGSDRAC